MLWGWIIASIMTQFVGASMAELCSSMPTAVMSYLAVKIDKRAACTTRQLF